MIDEGGVFDVKRPALSGGDPHGYRVGVHGGYCERFVPGGVELLADFEVLDYGVLAFGAHGLSSERGGYNKFVLNLSSS